MFLGKARSLPLHWNTRKVAQTLRSSLLKIILDANRTRDGLHKQMDDRHMDRQAHAETERYTDGQIYNPNS
jgi:hypothetical protein